MALGGGIPLLALIATAAGAPAPARRAPMMRVDFDAPAGCSSAEAFRRGVATRLERTTTSDGVPPARIQVRLTRKGDRVVGELRLSHDAAATDTRTVEGATCDEVVDVLALTAALALQPAAHADARPGSAGAASPPRSPNPGKEAGTAPRATASRTAGAGSPAASRAGNAAPAPRSGREASAAASASAPPPPPTPAPASAEVVTPPPPPAAPPSPLAPAPAPPVAVERRAPTPSAPVGTHFEVGASAAFARILSAASGPAAGPGPNLGGGVMLGLSQLRGDRSPRSLRLGWLYLPNDFLLSSGAVVDKWYAFTLTACPGWGLHREPFDVQVCARGIGGWLTATDAVITSPSPVTRAWVSAGALLRGGAALGAGFALELEAGVDAPLFRREFITTPPRVPVAETPPVSLLVGIGLSRRL